MITKPLIKANTPIVKEVMMMIHIKIVIINNSLFEVNVNLICQTCI